MLRQCKIVLLTALCTVLTNIQSAAQDSYDEKHIEVGLRMIGHQVLLNAGDSTSRVLPIIKSNEHYKIEFESEFEIVPEELVATVDKLVKETQIAEGYILEVEECETGKVVYSYEIVHLVPSNIVHCTSRLLPECCYSFIFTLKEHSDIESDSLVSMVNLNTATIDPLSGGDGDNGDKNYLLLSLLVLGIAGVSFLVWKRNNESVEDPNLIPIGKYYFDKRNTELRIEDQKIELTSKEADLLLFLYDTVNTTVERQGILKREWGDEGDYVGRTLDVFISKLRKKLEADASVKIINIRGVGYKLVADV